MQIKEIFSELNGFVIYEPILLQEYLKNNQLTDKNVLNYLTETEYGDLITEEGIAIPIVGLTSDYYTFKKNSFKLLVRPMQRQDNANLTNENLIHQIE